MTSQTSYDYIIAGGGSAGCTLAARLSEDPSIRVLLIEAGGNGRSLFTRMPAGNGILIGNRKFDWGLKSTPQPGMNGGHIYFPRGLGLGGSSLLNGMIYIRGNAKDYDGWAAKGLEGWAYKDVLPYFKRSAAASHRLGDPFHGQDGAMKLSPAANHTALSEMFISACQEAGAPLSSDFNGPSQLGIGQLDAMAFDGLRQSSAQAYLHTVPDNLTILTHTRLLKLNYQRHQVTGVKTDKGDFHASREVILSMGAFHSPQMLMLSGIGPADHLQAHGIDVKVDLPGVGSRLYDHPNIPMQYDILDGNLSMARYQRIDRAIWMGLRYLFNRSGPGAGPFWSAVLFHALHDKTMPEIEVFFTPMVVREEAEGGGWNIQTLMNPGKAVIARGKMARPGFQFDVNLLRPKSYGTVRLKSSDPLQMPEIDPGYFTEESDLDDLVEGMRHMRDVAAQPGLRKVVAGEFSPGITVHTTRDLKEAARRLATTGHHPACTCAMGPDDDPDAVLDDKLHVRGIEGLRVVDASSFPEQISGNINAPIIMMAEKTADIILGRPPLPPEDPRETS